MPRYDHHEIRFDAPPDWDERTIVSFAAPRRAEQPVSPNVVLTRDHLDEADSLEIFAERQLVELSRRVRGLELLDRRTSVVGDAPAIELRFRQESPLGKLEQRLVFFCKRDTVFTVTTTVAASEAEAQNPMFDRILATFDLSSAPVAANRDGSEHVGQSRSAAR